ncbi:ATP-grasp domain-containing protein, partial [Sulfurimonas sp. SAG-AH-194-I05]
ELKNIINTIDNNHEYIIQKYIGSSDQEYTTTVYKNSENIKVITFKRTLDGDKTGYAAICHSEKLERYSKLIANEFSLDGSINIQSRMFGDDYYIFEINPRISSTVYIRNHFYFTDLTWWICDLYNIYFDNSLDEIKRNGIGVIGYTYAFYDDIIKK